MTDNITVAEIASILATRVEDLISALGLQGRYDGNDYVAFNPTRSDKHLGSFRICVRGAKRGVWAEFAGNFKGDCLDLINYCLFGNKTNKFDAVQYAKRFLGLDNYGGELQKVRQQAREFNDKQRQAAAEQKNRFLKLAQSIYFQSKSEIRNTPVDSYLKSRGIDLSEFERCPRALRYNPQCYYDRKEKDGKVEKIYKPAMIAAVHDRLGNMIAVHRTFLDMLPEGGFFRLGKKALGDYAGGAIHLWRGDTNLSINELTHRPDKATCFSDTLIICEGIEDGLSIALACPQYRIWTSLSVPNMQNIIIPEPIKTVIIAADDDEDGSPAAIMLQSAINSFQAQGKEVKISAPEGGHDFNDMLTGKNYKNSY